MNRCKLCKEEFTINDTNIINSKSIMIKLKDGTFVCNGCNDALSFMEDLNAPDLKKDNEIKNKNIQKIKSESICINKSCENKYSGPSCPKCNLPNPLFKRKKKRKKCKKKKK
jgi:hypothetical protein